MHNRDLSNDVGTSGDVAKGFRFSPSAPKAPGVLVDGIQVSHIKILHVDEPILLHSFNQVRRLVMHDVPRTARSRRRRRANAVRIPEGRREILTLLRSNFC